MLLFYETFVVLDRAPRDGQTPHVTVITPTRDGNQGTLPMERDRGMREQKGIYISHSKILSCNIIENVMLKKKFRILGE